ncbi:ABC transporter permease [Alcaligenaceae bacterium 429]|nr:ABC transporter permease [Alcaligenaceae bacterium 429]
MKKSWNLRLGLLLVAIVGLLAILALFWTPYDPMAINLRAKLTPPTWQHWLGTDEFGRDILSRAMIGATTSWVLSLVTVSLTIIVGTLLGLIAGFLRGPVDRALMTINDTLLAFPGILLAMAVLVIIGANQWGIVLALSLSYIPSVLRVVRGNVLSIREREYIEASVLQGNSLFYTMLRHVLPNCFAPVAILATSMFGWVILSESSLSFLGLGVPPPAPTWGNMLASARSYMHTASWLGIAPGVCISLTLLGINLLGDALRDHLDPRTH